MARKEEIVGHALKMEERTASQGNKQRLQTGKGKEMNSPFRVSGRNQVCRPLDFSTVELISEF